MPENILDHLDKLRGILLTLKDTGDSGFEGLVAAVLSEIAGQPFRLASSGAQHGRDGESSLDAGAIYFEAKLYRQHLPKEQVLSKITETGVGTARYNVDVWVLASTQGISAQHVQLYRGAAERFGIGFLVLDWSTLALPPLAVALAAGADATRSFFARQPGAANSLQSVTEILDAISGDARYRDLADRLRANVRSPSLGVELAAARSGEWLEGVFSSRIRALADFGQPLAPADPSLLHAILRPALIDSLRPALARKPGVFAVLGEEGCGKSWLVAQTWLSSEPRALLVFLTPDELSGTPSTMRFEEVLRSALIRQASEHDAEAAMHRWRRRFDHWRVSPPPDRPRVVVAVDGLNQAPTTDWVRWVAAASIVLEKLGGSLVLTSRQHFFDLFLRDHLTCAVTQVSVPLWSISEVRSVLEANSVDPNKVNNAVCESLRNPRLLGLAIDLLNAREVEQLTELSDDRLLFEYMQRYATIGRSGVTGAQFAESLRDHAAAIVERLRSATRDHLLQFRSELENNLIAVVQSRFFRPVEGHSARYELAADGLPLALGLSIVEALRREESRGRDPAGSLDTIVEPILSLDRTADVLGAAVIVATFDQRTSTRVKAVLIGSYVGLQNLPHRDFDAFVALGREAPGAFLEAARQACTSSDRIPNIHWITAALTGAREDERAWQVISEGVLEWLSTHSLSPEVALTRGHRPDSEADEKLLAKKRELEKRLNDLSPAEVDVLHQLRRVDNVPLDRLHAFAFSLVAGKPLAGFSDALVRWAFSNALNNGLSAPWDKFRHLVRFNGRDWKETREALTKAAARFTAPETSRVGKWALVSVLEATGGAHEATQASELTKYLTRDYPTFPSWRLVETYCASDPCDPRSEEPENISETAARFLAVDVTKLHVQMSQTSEDLFFRMARPGIARFRRDIAVALHRAFCEDVARREGLARRQGVWGVLKHSPLLQQQAVRSLVDSALRNQGTSKEREAWVTSQYMLWAAFPHLAGDEQLRVVAQLHGRLLLLNLMDATEAASPGAVDRYLRAALEAGDQDELLRVLAFLHWSGSPIPRDLTPALARLLESSESLIRAHVLGIAAGIDDEGLLMEAVGHWRGVVEDLSESGQESWSGSAALARAAERGLVNAAEIIGRISPTYYGPLVQQLGARAVELIAPRVDAAIRRAAESPDPPPTLRLAHNAIGDQHGPRTFDVSEDVGEPDDLRSALERMSETPEAFRERQDQVHKKFHEYWHSLSAAGGRLVLEAMSPDEVRDLLADQPTYVTEWLDLLGNLDGTALSKVRWMGALVAEFAASTHPAKATELLRRVEESREIVHFSSGLGAVSLERTLAWSGALRLPAMQQMCWHRLDRAGNDEVIADEVLSAYVAGADDLVRAYVDRRLALEEPAWIARAVTVCGYSGECTHSDRTLSAFENGSGFIGRAGKAARYAYDRNRWAAEWFRRMVAATDPDDLWGHSVLLAKIIDARCELWWSTPPGQGALLRRFSPTFRQELERRIQKWREKRRATLFGDKVPDPTFLKHHGPMA